MKTDISNIMALKDRDPFSVLGRHNTAPDNSDITITAFLPDVSSASINNRLSMQRLEHSDIFIWQGHKDEVTHPYQIFCEKTNGYQTVHYDPYSFLPQISDYDLNLFSSGKHWHAYRILGAHIHEVDGIQGILFSTWAPNAQRVSVVGNFNQWDGRCHPMRLRQSHGVWELFIPDVQAGEIYKFEILGHDNVLHLKTDPYAQQCEFRPDNASITTAVSTHDWQDNTWMQSREQQSWLHLPHSIYEVHLGSWKRHYDGRFYTYRELADTLIPYVKQMGFTHIELLPITEHPLDASWGYQTTGYFAVTSRFGTPDDFRYFVEQCHQQHIGVILDWAPAHFPKDAHGMARFDGTALYEHADPRRGEHQDWGTYIFNYGRNEVFNFLLSSAFYWLEEFHIDGLRVDAVASMLYLDYSREEGQWLPNEHGGRENLEAITFLQHINSVLHQQHPGCIITAEESTSYPMISRPTDMGGLGFSMKWNMGWMHDMLNYMKQDPINRSHHHDHLTFGQLYAYTENFVLPFSHDEVVHGKSAMVNKMAGDEWQRFANLRLLYTFMFSYPGKKLLFMGNEFGQTSEWNFDAELDWYLLQYAYHDGLQKLVSDLNHTYTQQAALHKYDFENQGFEWIDCNDKEHSIISYLRKADDEFVMCIFNFTPVPRQGYKIGVPEQGEYQIVLNSDSEYYSGSNYYNNTVIKSINNEWKGRSQHIEINLPPLSGLLIKQL